MGRSRASLSPHVATHPAAAWADRALARPQRTGSQQPVRPPRPAPEAHPLAQACTSWAREEERPRRLAAEVRLRRRPQCLPREVPIPATVNLCRCAAAARSSRSSSRGTVTPSSTRMRRPSSERRRQRAHGRRPAVAAHRTGDAAGHKYSVAPRLCVCVSRAKRAHHYFSRTNNEYLSYRPCWPKYVICVNVITRERHAHTHTVCDTPHTAQRHVRQNSVSQSLLTRRRRRRLGDAARR